MRCVVGKGGLINLWNYLFLLKCLDTLLPSFAAIFIYVCFDVTIYLSIYQSIYLSIYLSVTTLSTISVISAWISGHSPSKPEAPLCTVDKCFLEEQIFDDHILDNNISTERDSTLGIYLSIYLTISIYVSMNIFLISASQQKEILP